MKKDLNLAFNIIYTKAMVTNNDVDFKEYTLYSADNERHRIMSKNLSVTIGRIQLTATFKDHGSFLLDEYGTTVVDMDTCEHKEFSGARARKMYRLLRHKKNHTI